jgi:hypothetical protein
LVAADKKATFVPSAEKLGEELSPFPFTAASEVEASVMLPGWALAEVASDNTASVPHRIALPRFFFIPPSFAPRQTPHEHRMRYPRSAATNETGARSEPTAAHRHLHSSRLRQGATSSGSFATR